ncbi:MAG: hypothetical protein JWM34_3123 [Ilumatobacteraceae bacterium]|nr:hypothetical protein [Ilumatobacteraceae bacterium]
MEPVVVLVVDAVELVVDALLEHDVIAIVVTTSSVALRDHADRDHDGRERCGVGPGVGTGSA